MQNGLEKSSPFCTVQTLCFKPSKEPSDCIHRVAPRQIPFSRYPKEDEERVPPSQICLHTQGLKTARFALSKHPVSNQAMSHPAAHSRAENSQFRTAQTPCFEPSNESSSCIHRVARRQTSFSGISGGSWGKTYSSTSQIYLYTQGLKTAHFALPKHLVLNQAMSHPAAYTGLPDGKFHFSGIYRGSWGKGPPSSASQIYLHTQGLKTAHFALPKHSVLNQAKSHPAVYSELPDDKFRFPVFPKAVEERVPLSPLLKFISTVKG